MKKQLLMIKQLDRQLAHWQEARKFLQPKTGWVRTLRKALGLTTQQLAYRLSVNRSRIVKIEQAELENALTLRTLKDVANALNCDLVYALIPRQPLQSIVENQAQKIAQQKMSRIAHTMSLEDQSIDAALQKEKLEELIHSLLLGSYKHLWNEEK